MADKGIPFSAPMVMALLAGAKTQTRRLITPRGDPRVSLFNGEWTDAYVMDPGNAEWRQRDLPCAEGDRLYVREAYYQFGHWEPLSHLLTKGGKQKWGFVADSPEIRFDAPEEHRLGRHHKDPATPAWHKRLGRFMPRNASRLWLAVTEVRVQRLQDISEADAIAEGVERIDDPRGTAWKSYETLPNGQPHPHASVPNCSPVTSYRELWDSLHAEAGTRWADNPWIVAVNFDVHRGNIDAEAANG